MSVVEAERILLDELERLAPVADVPDSDWGAVRRRLGWSFVHRRLLIAGAVAAVLVAAGAATATYFALRSTGRATNGVLVIDGEVGNRAQVAAVGADGRLHVLWRCRVKFCGTPSGMSWSPDGTRLALLMSALGLSTPYVGLDVLSLRTRRLTHLTSGRACWGSALPFDDGVAWSHDGRWIALTCGSSRILLVRATGQRERVLATGLTGVYSPTWSPDGRRLAFSAGRTDHSAIYVIDVNGLHRRLLAGRGRTPAWSPSSSLIVYRGPSRGKSCGGLRLVDADTGRDATPPSDNPCHEFGPRDVTAPTWSPDGTEVAAGSSSGLYVMNDDGTDLRRVSVVGPYSGRPAWRPRRGRPLDYTRRVGGCC